MDLSTLDVLLGLAAIALITVAGIVVHHRRKPAPVPVPSSGAATPSAAETGRHHVPNGLLDSPTTRLQPDTLARARKPHA